MRGCDVVGVRHFMDDGWESKEYPCDGKLAYMLVPSGERGDIFNGVVIRLRNGQIIRVRPKK